MKEQIVKNRYLQLDGTPVEAPEWRRYVTPWTLGASFTAALLASAITSVTAKEKEDAMSTETLLAIAMFAVGARGLARTKLIRDFSRAGLNDYVIDTQPESQKHTCTTAQLNQILLNTKMGALIGAVTNIAFVGHQYATKTLVDALAYQLSFSPATLTHSYEAFYLANKVQKKEWTVIGRGEMQKQVETSPIAQPT